jgi:hypothetical protein
MNYLLAKVNDRKEKYRKVISGDTIFYSLPTDLSSHLVKGKEPSFLGMK